MVVTLIRPKRDGIIPPHSSRVGLGVGYSMVDRLREYVDGVIYWWNGYSSTEKERTPMLSEAGVRTPDR